MSPRDFLRCDQRQSTSGCLQDRERSKQFGDDTITGAADVFAWGTVLCYAAGAAPFGDGSAATVIGAILTRPPRLDTIPTPLRDIITAALQKDPTHRPTPAQLLDTLSDGTSSDGWLPPPVQAMLPEHTLPDATRPVGPQDASTEVLDSGRPARIDGPPQQQPTRQQPQPQRTRQYVGPPPDPAPTPPPPSGKRSPALAIGVAIGATVLIVIAVVVGITLSGQRTPAATDPSTVAASATEQPTDEPTAAPSTVVTPEMFIGNWQTVDGSARNIAVSIDPLTDGSGAYGLSITVVAPPECRGGNGVGTGTGSPAGYVIATTWAVACENDSSNTTSFDEQYTLDTSSNQLTDTQGLVYNKQ